MIRQGTLLNLTTVYQSKITGIFLLFRIPGSIFHVFCLYGVVVSVSRINFMHRAYSIHITPKAVLVFPPHLKYVAALPWET